MRLKLIASLVEAQAMFHQHPMNEILRNIDQAARDWNDSKLSKENREKARKEWYLLVKKFHEVYHNSSTSS